LGEDVTAGRVPPHDLDAEAAVLSACMLSAEALDEVVQLGLTGRFYSIANGLIWDGIVACYEAGNAPDIVNVASWLRDKQAIAKVGGSRYLAQLVDATPAVGHVEQHARTVLKKARLRDAIAHCHKMASEGYATEDTDAYLEEAEGGLSAIARQGRESSIVKLSDALQETFEEMVAAAERGDRLTGIPTGFADLDKLLAGLHKGEQVVVAARPGMGKAQPLDSHVLTPTGWRRIGDLVAGDWTIGADGKRKRVLGVYDKGTLPVWELTTNDNARVLVSDDHLWLTTTRNDRRAGRAATVRNTKEVIATIERPSGGCNHAIPVVQPIVFDAAESLIVAPWLLGAWLGDGSRSRKTATMSNPEPHVQQRIADSCDVGDKVVVAPDGITVRVNGGGLTAALKDLGLSEAYSYQRFIPKSYLTAGANARLELLRGLCDTDGYVTQSRLIEYCTTSPQLAEDIKFLVGSLGGVVSASEVTGAYRKNGRKKICRQAYRLRIKFPRGDVCPVSSPKHLARWKHGPGRTTLRLIKSAREVEPRPCRCIAVEGSLYVTDGFIVTHNTALVLNITANVAFGSEQQPGHAVAFFSLEMPTKQLATRMICSEARVDLSRIRAANLSPNDWALLTDTASTLAKLPIWIDDAPAISLLQLRAKARVIRQAAEREGFELGVIVVDYLQLMTGPGHSRENEVSEISRGLKALAKELGVTVISLSQLNRMCESRAKNDKRPILADLRESGAIEQDADTVVFIYRDDYYNPETTDAKGLAELIIAKQRNGPTGKVLTRYTGPYTRFDSLAHGGDYA
jgi:replicative DNA helicase